MKVSAQPRRVFSNAHTYHINSVDPSGDGEHFLSADDLRINLWSMEVADKAFTVVDIKPKNMEELKEVITCSIFHPQDAHMFMYSTSRGSIKVTIINFTSKKSDMKYTFSFIMLIFELYQYADCGSTS